MRSRTPGVVGLMIFVLGPMASASEFELAADSHADWSATGEQGAKGWYYGYSDRRLDVESGDGIYDPQSDFVAFRNLGAGDVGPDRNHWTGSAWALSDGLPTTSLWREGGRPAANCEPDTSVHWSVRRWVSSVAGEAVIEVSLRNLEGRFADGITARVYQNRRELWSATIPAGWTVSPLIEATLEIGDSLDFIVDPDGRGNEATGGIDTVSGKDDSAMFRAVVWKRNDAPVPPEFRRGDPNADGRVNLADALCVLLSLHGRGCPVLTCLEAGDVNGDAGVSIADPIYLLNRLFGNGPPPVGGAGADGTECGIDSDPEHSLGCERYESC